MIVRAPLVLLTVAFVLAPSDARAWPVSRVHDMVVGTETFARAAVESVVVDDTSIVVAEALPTREILITAKAPGRALVLFQVNGAVEAIRIRVREKDAKVPEVRATEAQREAAKKACPGLRLAPGSSPAVEATVATPACRVALLALFRTDDFTAPYVELMFTVEALGDQLLALREVLKREGLDDALSVSYSGATLVVKGKASATQRPSLLQATFGTVAGRLLLDGTFGREPNAASDAARR